MHVFWLYHYLNSYIFFVQKFFNFFRSLIYESMSTNSKTYEVGQFILDSVVPEIVVPIMKSSRIKPLNMEERINKTTAEISKKIKQKSRQITNWILNTKI